MCWGVGGRIGWRKRWRGGECQGWRICWGRRKSGRDRLEVCWRGGWRQGGGGGKCWGRGDDVGCGAKGRCRGGAQCWGNGSRRNGERRGCRRRGSGCFGSQLHSDPSQTITGQGSQDDRE